MMRLPCQWFDSLVDVLVRIENVHVRSSRLRQGFNPAELLFRVVDAWAILGENTS
jgi:hypothetical protein